MGKKRSPKDYVPMLYQVTPQSFNSVRGSRKQIPKCCNAHKVLHEACNANGNYIECLSYQPENAKCFSCEPVMFIGKYRLSRK